MEDSLFTRCRQLRQAGRKKEAKAALSRFITSFRDDAEREAFTRDFLPSHNVDFHSRIRHELYESVIFPVLLQGYHEDDPWCLLWLAKTIQNLYSAKHLYAQIENSDEIVLLKRAHALDTQSQDICLALLQCLIRWFEYCQHDWPPVILYGSDISTADDYNSLLAEVAFARRLDDEGHFSPFLDGFEFKVEVYQTNLQAGP